MLNTMYFLEVSITLSTSTFEGGFLIHAYTRIESISTKAPCLYTGT